MKIPRIKTHSITYRTTLNYIFLMFAILAFTPRVAQAVLTLSPTTLDFGPVATSTSRTLTLTVTNVGISEPYLEFVTPPIITGGGPFTVVDGCAGLILNDDESCTIDVTFSPVTGGFISETMIVEAAEWGDAPFVSDSVSLVGTGVDSTTLESTLLSYAGSNPSVRSTAEVISDTCTSGRASAQLQADCDALILAAESGDTGTVLALLEITPERATKASGLIQQGASAQLVNTISRILELRNGASGFSVAGLTLDIKGQTLTGDHLSSIINAGDTGGSAGSDGSLFGANWGGFITGTIVSGDKDSTSLESGLDFDTKGILAGIDYRFNDQFVLGGAIGYMKTDTDLDNDGGKLDADGYSLTAYGTYYTEQSFFIDFLVTYGINDFDQDRRVSYLLQNQGITEQTATADYDGDMLTLFVGGGYNFNHGSWTLGPRLSLEYVETDVDDFTETMSVANAPGAGWATHIDDTDQQWLTLKLGGKISYAHSTTWGVLTPYAGLDWLHEFKDDSQVINGNFIEDPGSMSFSIYTESPDKNYFQLTLGVSAVLKGGIIGYLNYDTILSNDLWNRDTFNAGIRMEF